MNKGPLDTTKNPPWNAEQQMQNDEAKREQLIRLLADLVVKQHRKNERQSRSKPHASNRIDA